MRPECFSSLYLVNIWILKLHLLHSLFKNIFLNPKIYKVNCNHTHFQLLFRQSPPLTMFTFHILLSALVLSKTCSAISPKPAVNIATICKGKNRKVRRALVSNCVALKKIIQLTGEQKLEENARQPVEPLRARHHQPAGADRQEDQTLGDLHHLQSSCPPDHRGGGLRLPGQQHHLENRVFGWEDFLSGMT